MIIVGYVYNNNGMATWCYETAYALHENGYNVLLVHSSKIILPNNLPFKTFAFDFAESPANSGLVKKIKTFLEVISSSSNQFSFLIQNQLKENNIQAQAFFLNQSNLVYTKTTIPQYVCSWVYPFTLKQYITSSFTHMNKGVKNKVLALATAMGFYRKDLTGFKNATYALAITEAMHKQLIKKRIKSYLLPPCCEVITNVFNKEQIVANKKISIVISALELESKRKNIIWLLQCLNKISTQTFEITLIGKTGNSINEFIKNSPHTFYCSGQLNRNDALKLMQKADIFLFASLSDDWGYVIVEAMSKGLAVLVPNNHPFNFIVETNKYCFELNNENDFTNKLLQLINTDNLIKAKQHSLYRTEAMFSRKQFANNLQPLLANL
ncbi:MAG: glycosyltransferase [Bacteroidetes bacterium]|nr:glycosyltransferase [Bacteroidota bacterium]MBS1649265.1 glycosyltransferase [Bacteroidota bacterium]